MTSVIEIASNHRDILIIVALLGIGAISQANHIAARARTMGKRHPFQLERRVAVQLEAMANGGFPVLQ